MYKRFFGISLILAVCFFASSAEAKFGVKRNSNMNFGTIASSIDGAGTATINTNADTKTLTGSIFDFGGTVVRAKFQVSGGTPSGFVAITLPASFTISKGGVTLTVDNLAMNVPATAQMDGAGALTIYVSGRLTVPINQAPKSGLSGSFIIDVEDIIAATSDDASATVAGAIVAPITISATTPLSFGTVSSSSIAGTLNINTSGVATAVNVTQFAGSIVSEGVFTVSGDGGASFSVTLPTSTTVSNGSSTMTVDNFDHDAGVSPSISGGGSRALSIGATLNVGANQAGGTYTGNYDISVNYN